MGMFTILITFLSLIGPPPPEDVLSKQRMRLTMKILGSSPPPASPNDNTQKYSYEKMKPTYKEKFIPPDVSIVSYLMTKVSFLIQKTLSICIIYSDSGAICIPCILYSFAVIGKLTK